MDIVMHHASLELVGTQRMYMTLLEYPRGDLPPDEHPRVMARITPADVFESYAADYEIDVNEEGGWDDLLDLWAYAFSLGESAESQTVDPDHLFNAPTVEHARRVRLNKIRKVRGRGRLRGVVGKPRYAATFTNGENIEDSGEREDPIEFIKRTAPMSREHIEIKRAFTHRQRNAARAMRLGARPGEGLYEGQTSRVRDMKLYRRETPEELSNWLLGALPIPTVDGKYYEPPSALNLRRG